MYYNEAGEPLGWDYPSIDDPHHEEYEWFIRPIDFGDDDDYVYEEDDNAE